MKLALFVVALVATATANPIGNDPCTWGPDYWCSDENNADKCSATQYCMENVWKTETKAIAEPGSPDPLCGMCELIFATLKSELSQDVTVERLTSLLDEACNALPSGLEKDCTALVKEFTPVIVQLFNSTTPETICTDLTVCPASAILRPKAPLPNPNCGMCKLIFATLKSEMSQDMNVQKLISLLDRVCDVLPAGLQNDCTGFVKDYTPMIAAAFNATTPETICTDLTVCPASVVSRPSDGPFCELCTLAITLVEKELADNATEQQVISAITAVCNISFLESFQAECLSLVKEEGPKLYEALLSEDPNKVCSLLTLCTSAGKTETTALAISRPSDGPFCELCTLAITLVEKELADNATEQQVIQAITAVCNISFLSSFQAECLSLVREEGPQLYEALLSEDPNEVCSLLTLCTSAGKMKTTALAISSPNDGPFCELCTLAVTLVEKELTDNATEQQVISAITAVCNISFLESFQAECLSLVREEGPQIYEAIVSEDPNEVCSLLTLCTSTGGKTETTALAISRPSDGPFCELCTLAITLVEKELADNATEQQVISAITAVCNISFLESFQAECLSLVKEEGPQLYEALVSEDPNKVCSLLTLCTSAGKTETTALAISRPSDGPFCELCTLAITLVEKELADNATEQQVIQAITAVCNISFLSSFQAECLSLVKEEGPQLYEALVSEDPNKVCNLLTLCTSAGKMETTALAVSRPSDGPFCELCTLAVTLVEKELTDNATEQQVISAITAVCNISFLESFQAECLSLVREEGPQIYEAIVSEDPNEVCSLLTLCVDNLVATETNEMCTACELVTRTLQAEISKNGTMEEITSVLNDACDLVSSATTRIECKGIVVTYVKQLLETFAKEDPEQACTSIGLCTGSYLLKGSEI